MTRKLDSNCIEIWQVKLNESMHSKFKNYFYILSQEEKERVNSFKLVYLKKHYILSRIILRLLLSEYTGLNPRLIRIYKNKYGKPFIKSNKRIRFNISYSEDKLVIAVANFEVGIDIEYINPNFNFYNILNITLSENEKSSIKELCYNLQKKKFYLYWTQKEALLKAVGTGINIDLNTLEVYNNVNVYKGKKWFVTPINVFDKNYIGHVVYNCKNSRIIHYYN